MTEAVIVAVITGGLSLTGTLIASYFSNKKNTALILYRIEDLEKKVNKHNNLVERMIAVERSCEFAHDRIDRLERVKDCV